jgi:hypothetical protein
LSCCHLSKSILWGQISIAAIELWDCHRESPLVKAMINSIKPSETSSTLSN